MFFHNGLFIQFFSILRLKLSLTVYKRIDIIVLFSDSTSNLSVPLEKFSVFINSCDGGSIFDVEKTFGIQVDYRRSRERFF